MPLTEAEYAFIVLFTLEGFPDHLPTQTAWDSMMALGLIPSASRKIFSFQYLSQEQAKIENRLHVWHPDTGELLRPPVVPCPWPDSEAFYRRWEAIVPELVAIVWEKSYATRIFPTPPNPNHARLGPIETHPFLSAECEFLAAFYTEFQGRQFGPCFRQVAQADISHFDILTLVNRYRNEILHRGQHWPPPHSPDPSCPWPDNQSFTFRFDRELNPYLYYRDPDRPDSEPFYQSPADRFK